MMGLIKIVIFCENFKSTDCPSVSNSIFKPKWLSQWWWSSLLYYVVHEGKITNNYCEIETIDMSNKNYKKKSENNFKQCCFLLNKTIPDVNEYWTAESLFSKIFKGLSVKFNAKIKNLKNNDEM